MSALIVYIYIDIYVGLVVPDAVRVHKYISRACVFLSTCGFRGRCIARRARIVTVNDDDALCSFARARFV